MADPLTVSVLASLAVQKFVETSVIDLAKRFTTEAFAKSRTNKFQKAALDNAIGQAITCFFTLIHNELVLAGLDEPTQKTYERSLMNFIDDKDVRTALGVVFDPSAKAPNATMLEATWKKLKLKPLPDDFDWSKIAKSYKHRVDQIVRDSSELRDLLNSRNIEANHSKVNLSFKDLSFKDFSFKDFSFKDFSNAILSNANLSNADLSNADLSNADLSNADLNEANLNEANLSNANLSNANLSNANLSNANLSNANLYGVQALQTNFNSAVLTGACIEDWNINSKTELENIVCQAIYLKMNLIDGKFTNRRPSDEDAIFADGDFARLVRKAQDTVDLIFRNGIDWKALAISMERFKVESNGAELTIQAIENKGEDDFVIKVNVPADANKSELEKFLKQKYEFALNTLESQYRSQLEAKDREIEIQRHQNTNLTEIMKLMASRSINVVNTAISESNRVSDNISINQSGAINPNASVAKDNARVQNILHNYPAEQQKSLAEAAAEIQQLLEQLSATYPTTTIAEKSAVATKAIDTIEKNPAQKAKIVKALKAGGIGLLKELVEPVMKPVTNILFPMLEALTED